MRNLLMELPYHLLRAQGPPTVSAWDMLMCVVKNVNSHFLTLQYIRDRVTEHCYQQT